jgi:hypothetical protein
MTSPYDTKMREDYPHSEKLNINIFPPSLQRNEMAPRRVRTFVAGFAIIAFFYFVFTYGGTGIRDGIETLESFPGLRADCGRGKERLSQAGDDVAVEGNELVPLEAHIMSKCPDARVSSSSSFFGFSCPFICCCGSANTKGAKTTIYKSSSY